VYPEDRVLVGVMPDPADFVIAREQQWYRVPVKHAPKGIHAEYVAFYFTSKFSDELRWAIHFYARRTGHELVRRVDLMPHQPDHPRAEEQYYKLQLGPLKQKDPPIVSVRWRRISFIQTTWDRFVKAREVNDLYANDSEFVDRVYHVLKSRGIQPDRAVAVREGNQEFLVDLLIPCRDGAVLLSHNEQRPSRALGLVGDEAKDMQTIDSAIKKHGGPLMIDLPL
jgi:hypothetical protein